MWEEPPLVRRHIKRIQGDTFSARIKNFIKLPLFLYTKSKEEKHNSSNYRDSSSTEVGEKI